MEMKFSFERLDVWHNALDFAQKVYSTSSNFPKEELYGITSQIRRAGLSIATNIAEGTGRNSRKEYRQFVFMARGSLYETITLFKMCLRLNYVTDEQYESLINDCQGLLSKISGLLNYLKEA